MAIINTLWYRPTHISIHISSITYQIPFRMKNILDQCSWENEISILRSVHFAVSLIIIEIIDLK